MADFDAIVVGAGCAGSVAAYELAKAGKEVLLIERGNFAGANAADLAGRVLDERLDGNAVDGLGTGRLGLAGEPLVEGGAEHGVGDVILCAHGLGREVHG